MNSETVNSETVNSETVNSEKYVVYHKGLAYFAVIHSDSRCEYATEPSESSEIHYNKRYNKHLAKMITKYERLASNNRSLKDPNVKFRNNKKIEYLAYKIKLEALKINPQYSGAELTVSFVPDRVKYAIHRSGNGWERVITEDYYEWYVASIDNTPDIVTSIGHSINSHILMAIHIKDEGLNKGLDDDEDLDDDEEHWGTFIHEYDNLCKKVRNSHKLCKKARNSHNLSTHYPFDSDLCFPDHE